MSKHTPGPWRYWTQSRAGRGEDTCTFVSADSTEVLRAVTKTITEADADLIAAAPDLLEALKLVMPALEHMRLQWPRSEFDDSIDIVANARTAIAKAEGRT
jgi:hypothetical protein